MRNKASLRPTANIIKKSLFDILGDMRGVSFLDLFAGVGSVGLEALKRGAKEVVFVEKDINYIKRIKKELSRFEGASFRIIALDVFKAIKMLKRESKFYDLIFLDPPYYKDLEKKTLKILNSYDILAPTGFIIVQHYIKEKLPPVLEDLILFKQRKHGQNLLSFYLKRDSLKK